MESEEMYRNTAPDPVEPEYKIKELRDGTMIEIIPKSEFWTSVVIVIISLVAIPYLYYCLFSFYDKIDLGSMSSDDKSLYEKLWIGSIVLVVLLSISVIIFISFYFKNFNKRAFAQDNISISKAFKLISRELAQHAADKYSDNRVDAHMEDMATLGGRIGAAGADKWYSDPEEFKRNYVRIKNAPGNNVRQYQKRAVPLTVQTVSNEPVVFSQESPLGGGPQIPLAPVNRPPVTLPPVTLPPQDEENDLLAPYVPW